MKTLNFKELSRPTPTATRVQRNTASEINRRISRESESSAASAASSRESIDLRLKELEREWDIERALQANFGVLNLACVTLGALVARPLFLLTGVAGYYMAKHALQGWCPPVPVFRRLGFRTAREITQERYALQALRGDFDRAHEAGPAKAYQAAAAGEAD